MSEVLKIFEEFHKVRDRIEISIEEMKADIGHRMDKICLYGAGSAGIAFLYYLRDIGIEPRYFVDKNESRWGKLCEGIEIISPEQIIPLVGEEALVIVTINTDGKRYCKSFEEALRKGGHTGVHQMLREKGVKYDIDYTYFRRCHSLFHGDPYNLPSCSDIEIMLGHIGEIEEVYGWLADDLSRDIFLKILKFRLIDDSISIPTNVQDKQYFEYDFYPKRNDEVFIDCGAYDGISLRTFLKENDAKFDMYYGIEPDRENYIKLRNYIDSLPEELRERIHSYNCAAGSKKEAARLYALHGPGSFMADIGTEIINTDTIDNIVGENKVTYIKMNIEGSELSAIQGAERSIKRHKPKLAVAGYHKTWDLWEIPRLLKSYNPEYKLYLRSYMNHISFVYYLC